MKLFVLLRSRGSARARNDGRERARSRASERPLTQVALKRSSIGAALCCAFASFLPACSGGGISGTSPSVPQALTAPTNAPAPGIANLSPAAAAPIYSTQPAISTTSLSLTAALTPAIASAGNRAFYDDFENDHVGRAAANWITSGGSWNVCQPPGRSHELCEISPVGAVSTPTVGSQNSWTNYHVDAYAVRDAAVDSSGGVAILGRMRDLGHFYQLELRSDYLGSGHECWYIWRYDGKWTEIAGGPFTTHPNAEYQLRLAFAGNRISAYVAYDYSNNFVPLGSGTDDSYASGGIGLRVWNNDSERFDDVSVTLDGAVAPTSPTATPGPPNPPAPVPPPPVAPPPGEGTMLWKIGDSYVDSPEGNGSDVPIMSGGTASFAINRSSPTTAAPEYRNTASIEVPAGNKYFLKIGGTYAFRFNLAKTMTADAGSGAQMLLWQIANNGQAGLDNPPLAFQLRTLAGINYLTLYNYAQGDGGDGSIVWKTPYVAGGSDSWEFDVHLSKSSDGYVKVFKDGALAYTYNGLTVNSGATSSLRTDFGAYESQWKDNPTYSDLTHQGVTFNNFTISDISS